MVEKKERSKNTSAPTNESQATVCDGGVFEPLMARAFLQHVLQRAQEHRERNDMQPVDALQHAEVRLIDLAQDRQRDGDEQRPARH